jgi:ATP-dependent Clp protease protease subunit
MSRTRTELEDYLVYGVDEKHRRIFFGCSLTDSGEDGEVGGITQTSVELAIRAIERMILDAPKTPIELHVMSEGGDPRAILALHDVIQAATCQIKFYGRGSIMSAAVALMACCDERYLYPNTTIMLHDGTDSDIGSGRNADIYIDAAEWDRLNHKFYDIYAHNSKMPKKFWMEACKRDLYMSAEEAIQLGLADKIIPTLRRGNYRKVRQNTLKDVNPEKLTKLAEKLFERIKINSIVELTILPPVVEEIDDSLTIEQLPAGFLEEEVKKATENFLQKVNNDNG